MQGLARDWGEFHERHKHMQDSALSHRRLFLWQCVRYPLRGQPPRRRWTTLVVAMAPAVTPTITPTIMPVPPVTVPMPFLR